MNFPILPPKIDPEPETFIQKLESIGGIESILIFTFVTYSIFYRKPYFAAYVIFYIIILTLNNTKTTSQQLLSYSLIFLFLTSTTSVHYSLFIIGIFIAIMHTCNKESETNPTAKLTMITPHFLGFIYAIVVYYCTKYYLSIQLQIQEEPYINLL